MLGYLNGPGPLVLVASHGNTATHACYLRGSACSTSQMVSADILLIHAFEPRHRLKPTYPLHYKRSSHSLSRSQTFCDFSQLRHIGYYCRGHRIFVLLRPCSSFQYLLGTSADLLAALLIFLRRLYYVYNAFVSLSFLFLFLAWLVLLGSSTRCVGISLALCGYVWFGFSLSHSL